MSRVAVPRFAFEMKNIRGLPTGASDPSDAVVRIGVFIRIVNDVDSREVRPLVYFLSLSCISFGRRGPIPLQASANSLGRPSNFPKDLLLVKTPRPPNP
jgi:hypothetical protein